MIRVVFDTNVLYSAILKHSSVPARRLDLVTAGVLTPCLSDALKAEYREALRRPVLQPHASRVLEIFDVMERFSIHVSPTQELFLCSDPDDNCFLECAIAAEAVYLVTGNVRHFPRDYEPVQIVTPRRLLHQFAS